MTRAIPITQSGILAEEFCRDCRSAEVAAVFDRSFYLRSGDTFICIASSEVGNGPLTLVADNRSFRPLPLGVRPGQAAFITEQHVQIDECVGLSLDHCEPWRAPPWPIPLSSARLIGTFEQFAARFPSPPRTRARGGRGDERQSYQPGFETLARNAFRTRLANFEKWLSDGCNPAWPDAVHGLIGLGPGLTPAGDDCLVGALALLDALGECNAYAALARTLADVPPTLTSPLSHCFLRAAAARHVGESLHRAVSSIITGNAGAAVAALRTIGHSSGWDMLAGIATALRAVVATPELRRVH
jgi:uncharacterized protein DUF2877